MIYSYRFELLLGFRDNSTLPLFVPSSTSNRYVPMMTREGSNGAMRIHDGGSWRIWVCLEDLKGASSREVILVDVSFQKTANNVEGNKRINPNIFTFK